MNSFHLTGSEYLSNPFATISELTLEENMLTPDEVQYTDKSVLICGISC